MKVPVLAALLIINVQNAMAQDCITELKKCKDLSMSIESAEMKDPNLSKVCEDCHTQCRLAEKTCSNAARTKENIENLKSGSAHKVYCINKCRNVSSP